MQKKKILSSSSSPKSKKSANPVRFTGKQKNEECMASSSSSSPPRAEMSAIPVSFTGKQKNEECMAASSSSLAPPPDSTANTRGKTVGVKKIIESLSTTEKAWMANADADKDYSVLLREKLGPSHCRLHNALVFSIAWMMTNFEVIQGEFPYSVSREYTIIDKKLRLITEGKARNLRGDLDFIVRSRRTKKYCVVDVKTSEYVPSSEGTTSLDCAVMKRINVLQLRVYAVLAKRHFKLTYTPACYIVGVNHKLKTDGFAVWKLANTKMAVDLESALSSFPKDYRLLSAKDFAEK